MGWGGKGGWTDKKLTWKEKIRNAIMSLITGIAGAILGKAFLGGIPTDSKIIFEIASFIFVAASIGVVAYLIFSWCTILYKEHKERRELANIQNLIDVRRVEMAPIDSRNPHRWHFLFSTYTRTAFPLIFEGYNVRIFTEHGELGPIVHSIHGPSQIVQFPRGTPGHLYGYGTAVSRMRSGHIEGEFLIPVEYNFLKVFRVRGEIYYNTEHGPVTKTFEFD